MGESSKGLQGKFWSDTRSRSPASSVTSVAEFQEMLREKLYSNKKRYFGIVKAFAPNPIPDFMREIFEESGFPHALKIQEASDFWDAIDKIKPQEIKTFLIHKQAQIDKKAAMEASRNDTNQSQAANKARGKSRKNSEKNKRLKLDDIPSIQPETLDTSINTEEFIEKVENDSTGCISANPSQDLPPLPDTPTEENATPTGSTNRSIMSTPIPPSVAEEIEEVKKPKPLVVERILDVPAFTKKLHDECTAQFVQALTYPAKMKIIEYLKKAKIYFYNVPDDVVPTRKFVIKGLRFVDPELVSEELTAHGFKIISCKRMISEKDKRTLPHLVVTAEQELRKNILKEAKKITHIFHVKVQIDPFRPPRKVLQCYRCQGFYHRAANCFRQERCVACGGEHNIKQCPRKQENSTEPPPVKCVNCEGNHPASYKGCKNFPIQPHLLKKKQIRNPTSTSTDMPVNDKSNFPDMPNIQVRKEKTKTSEFPQPQPIYNPEEIKEMYKFFQLITRITHEISTIDIKSVNDKLKFALNRVEAISDPSSKLIMLANCLSEFQG